MNNFLRKGAQVQRKLSGGTTVFARLRLCVGLLCLKSPRLTLDRVSTGSGSDLVKPWKSKIAGKCRMLSTDQVATAPCTDPAQVRFLLLGESRVGFLIVIALLALSITVRAQTPNDYLFN